MIIIVTVAADDGKVRESGWIDIDLPNANNELEGPTDTEPMEQELDLSLEELKELPADDELPANGLDKEGMI